MMQSDCPHADKRLQMAGSADEPSRMSIEQRLGARIRHRRLELGLGHSEVASILGIPVGRLAAIEAGEIKPGAGELYDIAVALQTTASELFGDIMDDYAGHG